MEIFDPYIRRLFRKQPFIYQNDAMVTSFAATWLHYATTYVFECHSYACVYRGKIWHHEGPQRWWTMQCPDKFFALILPFVFWRKSAILDHYADAEQMSQLPTVTTKGYCIPPGQLKEIINRGVNDCISLDLTVELGERGVRPGDEVLFYLVPRPQVEGPTGVREQGQSKRSRYDLPTLDVLQLDEDDQELYHARKYYRHLQRESTNAMDVEADPN